MSSKELQKTMTMKSLGEKTKKKKKKTKKIDALLEAAHRG